MRVRPLSPHGAANALPLRVAVERYEAYLDSLAVRRHHGDGVFPTAEVRDLAEAAWAGIGYEATGDGRAVRALRVASLAAMLLKVGDGEDVEDDGACPGGHGDGLAVGWAGLLLPIGHALGPRLLAHLGGQDLWAGAAPCLAGAAFSLRLPGVPARARHIVLCAAEREDGRGPLGRTGSAIPLEALALRVAVRILGAWDWIGETREAPGATGEPETLGRGPAGPRERALAVQAWAALRERRELAEKPEVQG